ncbi:hypothetical protein [Butyricimonas synergistica]|mgnify:CR=1 FL=1|uniref:hypothetical protein n=1 Tax=Butyricimonas synergistica TaxID=544644 RepID=UPI00037423BD|nr:hypothetical protein [Butyricimonas synergistica]
MKTGIRIGIIALFVWLISVRCQDVTVGYLSLDYAGYEIDSLVVKKELDITPPIETPNPTFQTFVNIFKMDPGDVISMGIYPTIKTGGGEDYDRNLYGIPWTSTPIEGVDGTSQIYVDIKNVTTDTGDVDLLLNELTILSSGVFSLPLHNNVPKGRYKISLTFSNEGYSKDLDNCFTIIVK